MTCKNDTRCKLKDYATEYTFGMYKIAWRREELWAITDGNYNYDKVKKGWVYEPRPSSRTDEFIKRCRFGLLEAIKIIEELTGIDLK